MAMIDLEAYLDRADSSPLVSRLFLVTAVIDRRRVVESLIVSLFLVATSLTLPELLSLLPPTPLQLRMTSSFNGNAKN